MLRCLASFLFFFFNDTATTEIYTLSLHDALPIFMPVGVWTVYGTDQAARTAFIADMTEAGPPAPTGKPMRSEEHTSELQSQSNLVCRLLLEKKKKYRAPACHTRNQRPNMHPQNLH